MAKQQNKSIFSGVIDALRRSNRKALVSPREVLTGTQTTFSGPQSSVQQQQQEFLDVQSLKIAHDLYSRSVYYDTDRIGAYNDYRAMDMSPEVAAALDIITDEAMTRNEYGDILSIYSENSRVKKLLKDLFNNTLNIDYNLSVWIRDLIKFGDNFVKLEIDQKEGIYDARALPVAEIHREEAYDGNINSARFRWDINNMYFEEWQVAHFRLVNDGTKLPYGRSILDSARKLWKQLQLSEDAMLIYRIIRAPERRVHYIEVGNLDNNDVKQYIERVKRELKKQPIVDSNSGQVNLKYNPLPVWKDTPIPLLDGRILTIEELAKEYDSGKENFVYSVQDKTHRIVPGKVVWCGKNYTAKSLTKVWLDDETWVLTAPEHPFVLRDGTQKRADELVEGDSLMPFYRKDKLLYGKSNYDSVYNPESGTFEFTHRLVGNDILKEDKSYNTLHHIDFNKKNNNPNNLLWVDFYEHKKMHSELAKKMWKNPEYKSRMSALASENLKKRWENKEYRESQIKKLSKTLTEQWKSGKRDKEIVSKNIIRYNKSEEKIKRVSKRNKERNSIKHMLWYNSSDLHKEHNKIRKESLLKRWNNEKERKKLCDSMSTKTNKKCFKILVKEIKKINEFINAEKFIKSLRDSELYNILVEINPNTKRNLKKFFHKTNLRRILKENGINNYKEFLNTYNPKLLELKKEKYRKNRLVWNDKNIIKGEKGQFEYKNHKVLRIENIMVDGEDVYCMTVVGLNGEHDRHNFALYSFEKNGNRSKNGGVFVKNTAEEDYFLPIRGDKGSRIETLPGASNLSEIADIEYLQNKLFAALKVPKPFLNYAESLPGGSALAQTDLRFSRTINRIQESVLMELRRIANIHLYFLGFHDDLDNFSLSLTNPSKQQELLKLEIMKARLEVFKEMFTADATSPVSYTWAMENIMGFSKTEIKQMLRQKKVEKKMFSEIEQALEEYMETGLFKVIDDKFRKPGFIPDSAGGEEEPGLGGEGGFGGGSSLGGLGGGFGAGEAITGGKEFAGGEEALEAGGIEAEEGAGEFEGEELSESNLLLGKNNKLSSRTKSLVENIEKRLSDKDKEVLTEKNNHDDDIYDEDISEDDNIIND